MIVTSKHGVTERIEQILQLNPFDAVIIAKDDQLVAYNAYAEQLFATTQLDSVTLQSFFQEDQLLHIKSSIHNKQPTIKATIESIGEVLCHYTSFLIENNEYGAVIVRKSLDKDIHLQEHSDFIQQYKEAIVAVNLQGEIIYCNKACETLLLNTEKQPYVYRFEQWLLPAYREQFHQILQQTFNGNSNVLSNCLMNTEIYKEYSVSIQAFPTYSDQKIIGAHIVIKKAQLFYAEQTFFQQVAYQDELTGLPNRRALHEQWAPFENSISENPMALLLVDIDRFKKFNESIGKQKTDELLASVSKRLNSIQQHDCHVFHYNGDEFVIIIQNSSKEAICEVADNLLAILNEPFIIDDQEYFITVSIGISYLQSNERLDLKALLHRANQALYYVKKHGRGVYKFYHGDMEHEFLNEVLMEAHLRRAIEFNELTIHFQPQYNLLTEEINSLEALVRWNNRKFGSVSPGQFIPLAESSGLIIEIGYWILETVCQYIQQWQSKGYRPIRVAVNISPKQFKHAMFTKIVRTLIAKYNIEPQFLEFEITEGAMMDVDETTEILNELKKIGVYVSVDDFGTGYSSLSYLKSYPIDIIKIDQSFIRDIEIDEKNENIIKAIILLSHTLGLEVVAEGVEKLSQEAFLRNLKCEKVQGYLYNEPVPAAEIEEKYLAHV